MKRYHEAQELAPRDVVARAIVSEMHRTKSKHVYLDMTSKSQEFLEKRFPRIYETCTGCGLDLAADLAPVSPAAHFVMGGVKTDRHGRTSIPGLYAAGETADDRNSRCQSPGQQCPSRGIGIWRSQRTGDDEGCSGSSKREPSSRSTAPKTGNEAAKHPERPKAKAPMRLHWTRCGKSCGSRLVFCAVAKN